MSTTMLLSSKFQPNTYNPGTYWTPLAQVQQDKETTRTTPFCIPLQEQQVLPGMLTFPTQQLCQETLIQNKTPTPRTIFWNVVDSDGGVCRPSNDVGMFTSMEACVNSPLATSIKWDPPSYGYKQEGMFNMGSNPDAQGWVCSNPVLNQCIPQNKLPPDTPFSYKIYDTYQECKSAPENNIDSTSTTGPFSTPVPFQRVLNKWYIDSNSNNCQPSNISTAPFDSLQECQANLSFCLTDVAYSNNMNASDVMWREPYKGYRRDQGRNVNTLMMTPQIPINMPGEAPVIGVQQLIPGLAGQGYSLLA